MFFFHILIFSAFLVLSTVVILQSQSTPRSGGNPDNTHICLYGTPAQNIGFCRHHPYLSGFFCYVAGPGNPCQSGMSVTNSLNR
jgi:hypothetical protein